MSACQGSIPVPFKVCQRTSLLIMFLLYQSEATAEAENTHSLWLLLPRWGAEAPCMCVQAEELKEPPLCGGCNTHHLLSSTQIPSASPSTHTQRDREKKKKWEERAVELVGLSVSRHVFVLGPEASAPTLLSPPLSFSLILLFSSINV